MNLALMMERMFRLDLQFDRNVAREGSRRPEPGTLGPAIKMEFNANDGGNSGGGVACPWCDERFPTLHDFHTHAGNCTTVVAATAATAAGVNPEPEPPAGSEVVELGEPCPFCFRHFGSREELLQHSKFRCLGLLSLEQKVKCNWCRKKLPLSLQVNKCIFCNMQSTLFTFCFVFLQRLHLLVCEMAFNSEDPTKIGSFYTTIMCPQNCRRHQTVSTLLGHLQGKSTISN